MINSIYWIAIGLFRIFTSFCLSIGKMYFSRICSFHPSHRICGHKTLHNVNFLAVRHFGFVVIMFLLFLILEVCIFKTIIYLRLCCVFVAACRLSLVVASGGCSSLWYEGFSLQWILLLLNTGPRHAGFSSVLQWHTGSVLAVLGP